MKNLLRLGTLFALALTVIVAAGCAGGGAGGVVTEGSDSASGQVAAAAFVQEWAQILWGLVSSQTGSHPTTSGPPEFGPGHPPAWTKITFTGPDETVTVLTVFLDGSATLDTTYPDGSTQHVGQSVPVSDKVSKTTIDWELTTSEGLEANYTTVVDDKGTHTDISDDTTDMRGSSVLPDDQTQDFTVLTEGGSTKVQSAQSDGSNFTLTVPLAAPDFIAPDFAQSATGRYQSPDFDINFTLDSSSGAPSRWAQFTSDLGANLTGQFALDKDFSGSGRLLEDTRTIALLSWTRTGKMQVSFLSAGRGATSPAGAALDFLLHRWQTLAGLMAPAPGGASAQAILNSAH